VRWLDVVINGDRKVISGCDDTGEPAEAAMFVTAAATLTRRIAKLAMECAKFTTQAAKLATGSVKSASGVAKVVIGIADFATKAATLTVSVVKSTTSAASFQTDDPMVPIDDPNGQESLPDRKITVEDLYQLNPDRLVRFPIFEAQVRDARELPNVVGDEDRAVGAGSGDQEVVRSDRRSGTIRTCFGL
jgi:hypothetical protein